MCLPLLSALFLPLSLVQVWIEAALQIFYSLGVGFGGLLTFASYNTFHQNIYRSVAAVYHSLRPKQEESGSPGRPCGLRAWPAHSGLCRDCLGRDTFIVTLGNAITSILAGFAIFSVLGYMSQELGVPVDQVAKAGGQAARVSSGESGCQTHGTRPGNKHVE
jgi:solute carrier family 6 amino acid transporter-like protein 5/7/9/14